MADFNLSWNPWPAPPLTADDIQEWEVDFAMPLPAILARGLLVQNGGQVLATELTIDQLDDFSTLDEEQWSHVYAEESLKDLDRGRLLYVGESVGCGIVLDYTTDAEPRVLLIHHNLGGELRDEGVGSFEDLLRLLQSPPPEKDYQNKRSP
jgi:hypothetical protein